MRILIIGAGAAGQQLAKTLCAERHDVVVIDKDPEALEEIEAQLDILTVCGPGSSPSTLEQAEVAKADLLVAVTSKDEVNILACLLAHAAGVRHKVARISDTAYIRESGQFDLRMLGIDLVVSQKEECAQDLFNVLRLPGTIEVVDVFDGKAVVVGIKIDIDSPLAMARLNTFPKPEMIETIRFIALQRGDKLSIPRGDTQFMIGDDVYMTGDLPSITSFLQWAYPERPRFDRIVVAGGGDLGFHLAQLLETLDAEPVLLEPNTERAEFCADHLSRTLVLKSNPLEPSTMEDVGITSRTAFVATTEDDENNIICCLLADKNGACFTAAQVIKTSYAPIINSLSLMDRAVNPYTSMINAISRFIRGTDVEAATSLYSLPGELIEVRVPASSPWDNRTLQEIGTLRDGIIAAVLREQQIIPATGDLKLMANDRIVLYALPRASAKILAGLRGSK